MVYWWDYHCIHCKQTGSTSIDIHMPLVKACKLVIQAHARFNPVCYSATAGKGVIVWRIDRGDAKRWT